VPKKNGYPTQQEAAFTNAMVSSGDATYAAAKAGYSSPSKRAHQLMNNPAVVDEVRRRQAQRIENDLLPLAVDTLRTVMADPKQPGSTRVQAAKVVLTQVYGRTAEGGGKEPHEMSAGELQALVDQARRELAERSTLVIDHDDSGESAQGAPNPFA